MIRNNRPALPPLPPTSFCRESHTQSSPDYCSTQVVSSRGEGDVQGKSYVDEERKRRERKTERKRERERQRSFTPLSHSAWPVPVPTSTSLYLVSLLTSYGGSDHMLLLLLLTADESSRARSSPGSRTSGVCVCVCLHVSMCTCMATRIDRSIPRCWDTLWSSQSIPHQRTRTIEATPGLIEFWAVQPWQASLNLLSTSSPPPLRCDSHHNGCCLWTYQAAMDTKGAWDNLWH